MMSDPRQRDPATELRVGQLTAAFQETSATALLQFYQLYVMWDKNTGPEEGITLLAGVDLEPVAADPEHMMRHLWHISQINTFGGELEIAQKIYVRSSQYSSMQQLSDPGVSILWFATDLAIKPYESVLSPLILINELGLQQSYSPHLKNRADQLCDVATSGNLSTRTYGKVMKRRQAQALGSIAQAE